MADTFPWSEIWRHKKPHREERTTMKIRTKKREREERDLVLSQEKRDTISRHKMPKIVRSHPAGRQQKRFFPRVLSISLQTPGLQISSLPTSGEKSKIKIKYECSVI